MLKISTFIVLLVAESTVALSCWDKENFNFVYNEGLYFYFAYKEGLTLYCNGYWTLEN